MALHAASMACATSGSSTPISRLARAAARFTVASPASAPTKAGWAARGIPLTWKFSSARAVCIPHKARAGTANSPRESRSIPTLSSHAAEVIDAHDLWLSHLLEGEAHAFASHAAVLEPAERHRVEPVVGR